MSNRIINCGAFIILAVLWIGFGAAVVLNPQGLDAAWQMYAGWPLLLQALVGLLVLPVIVGLWIWETSWPLLLRLVLVTGLGWATLYAFFPGRTRSQIPGTVKNA